MSFNLKDFEVYLLKNDPKKFKNILGTEGYKMKLRELEGDKPKIDKTADTLKLSNSVPEVSTNIDTPETLNPDNLFYTNGKNGGTIKSDKGLYGFEGAGQVNNESGWESQKQIYDKANGGQAQNPIDKISTNISNTAPYAIPQADKKLRKQISDLETQQNNFLAANGGYVNTENLPILSGYQEKIAELRKQLETASQPAAQTQESGYATLGDAYADSVFNQAGAVRNTDTVTRQGGGTPGNEPLTLSAQGQTPGYVGLNDDDDDEKKSSEPESPIIPVAGGLFLNTETGEYINNYVDEGNEEESGEVEDPLIEEGNYYIESIQQYYLDKANSSISGDEFNEKYPEGILDEWTVGLGKIIGWEACRDYIDSASQIVKKDEESTDEPYTIYNNPEETGGEDYSDLGEAFMDDVVDREQEKGEIDAIKESLESLLKYANDNGNSYLSNYAQETLDRIMQNGGFSDTAAWYQKEPDATKNPVYIEEIDGARIEMETLNEWRLHEFGGDGTQLQQMIDKVKTLFWPPGAGTVNTIIGAIVNEIGDHYDPGQVLQSGDIRVSIQTPDQMSFGEKTNYFLRDGKLIYSIDTGTNEIIWGDVIEPPF